MTKNKEIYLTDPTQRKLLNEGVSSNNLDSSDAKQLDTLRYELETFVCEGEYHQGMERILSSYLTSFGRGDTPGTWVSGFYGSGKSHMVKILRFLWEDFTFEDGAKARGITTLPDDIAAHLIELDNLGTRHGTLVSAGGTLKAGTESVRMTLLGIIFKSLGLPERYPLARFLLDLKDEGHLDNFCKEIEKAGKIPAREIKKLYVSPVIAKAYKTVNPELPSDVGDIMKLLAETYPNPERAGGITIDEMLTAIRRALGDGNEIRPTLIVLDEIQQYIADNPDTASEVQEVVEACQKNLGGRMLVVGTGQSALNDTPNLQKLLGRFTTRIQLSDTDVTKVIRKVILAKREDKKPEIKTLIEKNEGEIKRQLNGTKLETIHEDDADYSPDYPILPVRKRFWERVLRSFDQTGTASQLRNQLSVAHQATVHTADKPLGNVIAADFIYTQIKPDLLSSGVMQREYADMIDKLDNGTEEGILKSRICSLVFLINRLPREAALNIGVLANPDHLADLMVENVSGADGDLRAKIPVILDDMHKKGELTKIDGEFRLLSRAAADWGDDVRTRTTRIAADNALIGSERAMRIKDELERQLGGRKISQGAANVGRSFEIFIGSERPELGSGIPVWCRDCWSETEKSLVSEIQSAPKDSPFVHVIVPKASAEDLKLQIAILKATEETLATKGNPTEAEGMEARQAVESRNIDAKNKLNTLVRDIVSKAKVFLDGGDELTFTGLEESVKEGGKRALARLYPRFNEADHSGWGSVSSKVKQGDVNALSNVGHTGDVETHPVAKEILSVIGASKTGGEIRRLLEVTPCGWPRDAIDACLILLTLTEHLRATDKGGQLVVAKSLTQTTLTVTTFKPESVILSTKEKMDIRKLFQKADVKFKSNEEAAVAPVFVLTLKELAANSGGDAPAPKAPDAVHLKDLEGYSGNELLKEIHDKKDRLEKEIDDWKTSVELVAKLLPAWQTLDALLPFAATLGGNADWATRHQAILDNRSLLEDPDPVPPLAQEIADALRAALNEKAEIAVDAFDVGIKTLEGDENWKALNNNEANAILATKSLKKPVLGDVGDAAQVLARLRERDLSAWDTLTAAQSARFGEALADAVKKKTPEAKPYKLKRRAISSDADLQTWLDETGKEVREQLKQGPVILD
jgi:hypothetical protein